MSLGFVFPLLEIQQFMFVKLSAMEAEWMLEIWPRLSRVGGLSDATVSVAKPIYYRDDHGWTLCLFCPIQLSKIPRKK